MKKEGNSAATVRSKKNSFLLDNRWNHFNKALSVEPDDPKIRYHPGYCEEMRGDWEFGRKDVFLGWLYQRTSSIWAVTIAHGSANNWGQFAFK